MKKALFLSLGLFAFSVLSVFAGGLKADTPVRVATDADGLMAPVWSPDGSMIAASGSNYTGIYVFNSDGTDGRQITDARGAGYKMAWSADGLEIVGRTNIMDGVRVFHETRAWNLKDGQSRVVTAKNRSNANPATANTKVTLLRQMTENAAEVTTLVASLQNYAGSTVINPALSPDGSMIAFQIVGNGMFVVNADGSNLRSLGTGSNPAWMPDNNTVVYTVVTDNGNEYTGSTIMSVTLNDMKKQVVMKDDNFIPVRPAITADGSRLAFENICDQAIYVVNLKK